MDIRNQHLANLLTKVHAPGSKNQVLVFWVSKVNFDSKVSPVVQSSSPVHWLYAPLLKVNLYIQTTFMSLQCGHPSKMWSYLPPPPPRQHCYMHLSMFSTPPHMGHWWGNGHRIFVPMHWLGSNLHGLLHVSNLIIFLAVPVIDMVLKELNCPGDVLIRCTVGTRTMYVCIIICVT